MTHINQRRDLSANWTSTDPVLQLGEVGWETNTLKAKLGDGVTPWTGLDYVFDLLLLLTQSVDQFDDTHAPSGDAVFDFVRDSLNDQRVQSITDGDIDHVPSADAVFDAFTGTKALIPWFQPSTYGAVGDDATDDTLALQDTIDACIAAGGGTVLISKQHLTTADLEVNGSKVTIMGLGPEAQIRYTGNLTALRFGNYANVAYVADNSVENLTIVGTTAAFCGVDIVGSQRTWVRNCTVKTFQQDGVFGIHFTATNSGLLSSDGGIIGGFVTDCCTGVRIDKGAGVATYGPSFIQIYGTRIQGYGRTDGLDASGGTADADGGFGIDVDAGEAIQGYGVRCTTDINHTTGIRAADSVGSYMGCAADNSFAGVDRTVTTKEITTNVAKITTSVAHGFAAGQTVTVAGVDSTFDGKVVIVSTPTTTTFTYALVHADVGSVASGGNVTDRNNIGYLMETGSAGASNGTILIGPFGNMKPSGSVDSDSDGVADGNTRFLDNGLNTYILRYGFAQYLGSMALTGNPTAPTAGPTDHDSTIANTTFVRRSKATFSQRQNTAITGVASSTTFTKITGFGTAVADTDDGDDFYSFASDTITILQDGTYLFMAGLGWATNATNSRSLAAHIAGVNYQLDSKLAAGAGATYLNGGIVRTVTAGDTFEVYGWQNSGSAIDSVAGGPTFMTVIRLG